MADTPTILEVRPGETENVTVSSHIIDLSSETVYAYVITGAGTRSLVGSGSGAAVGNSFTVSCSWPDIDDAVYNFEMLKDPDTANERNVLTGTWIVRLKNGRAS